MSKYLGIPKGWENYDKIPCSSLIQSAKLLENLQKRIKKVNHPILIIQAQKDRIIYLRGRKQILKAVSSEEKAFEELQKRGHIIMSDKGSEQSIDIIIKWFLERKSKDKDSS